MTGEKKLIFGVIVATVAILGIGIVLLMRSSKPSKGNIDQTLLIREDSEQISSPSASVTLVEFADYQCPACATYQPVVMKLLSEFEGKLNVVYRNFPLPQHKNARLSAYVAEAAGEQGKFWEMHDKLFEEQAQWSENNNAGDLFAGYAKDLGLDADKLLKDKDSEKIVQRVNRDAGDGNAVGVNSTPTFFLNGEKLVNPKSYEDFKALIQAAIEKTPLSQAPEEKYHTHFNLKAYVNGKPIDFSLPTYQSTEENELNPDIHFHDGNGDVVHIHKRGMTLGDLFSSFHEDLPSGTSLYVGDTVVSDWVSYEPRDLDRLLLSDSTGQNILNIQKDAVKDDACIYSEKCPERGKPPEETCVGGLGSGCDK